MKSSKLDSQIKNNFKIVSKDMNGEEKKIVLHYLIYVTDIYNLILHSLHILF